MNRICGVIGMLFILVGCSPDAVTPSALETRVRRILELPTYEHIYRDVIYFDEERSYIIFKTRKAVLFSVDVHVQAGLDLSKGFEINRRGINRLVVSLPPSEILRIDADEATILEYFVEERFDEVSRLDYYDALDRSKDVISADALTRGILERAQENAEELIRGVLQRAGFTDIEFVGLET